MASYFKRPLMRAEQLEANKNKGLQAARAIAALSVAYFHSYIALRAFPESSQVTLWPLKEWGFFGVNFFFAISGYVICLVASRPDFTIRSFVLKRIFRLYPMYIIAMTLVALLIVSGQYRPILLSNFLQSLTLLPMQDPPAYDVSWSMQREVVFYGIAAVAVPTIGLSGLAVLLAGLAATGFVLGNPWTFQIVSTTQSDFLAGVVAFLLRKHTSRLGFFLPLLIGLPGLWFTLSSNIAFGPSASMVFLVIALTNLKLSWDSAPARWLVAAGDASYSIYLLHLLTFIAMDEIAKLGQLPGWLCEPWRFTALLMCGLISYATWRMIERPFIRLGDALSGFKARVQVAAE
ncbi:acyltransferase [Bradyrhizobium sp. 164]|uniref:acyltransferase family protein n=1 Tax=Bradyrhizobium sp. 164 TaxID=2782637 RepID=UPI001FF9746F|nr:acyltransferase [Bradyrhizobium sp. 164]MCK1595919.1 acyltransferase [Bradyrhizobium sp. 164]